MMADCDHSKIQIRRKARGYQWSCVLCGNKGAFWDDKVWEQIVGEHLQEGEGFTFDIVRRGDDPGDLDAYDA
jgi:hypothetical protein